jgi:argininosuccinate synthase
MLHGIPFPLPPVRRLTKVQYDASESSMDEIGDFEPSETGGFIKVQAIRLKKYGQMKAEKGERL